MVADSDTQYGIPYAMKVEISVLKENGLQKKGKQMLLDLLLRYGCVVCHFTVRSRHVRLSVFLSLL